MRIKFLYLCGLIIILPIITDCKESGVGVDQKIEDINASLIAPKLDSEQATSITFQWASSEKVDSFYFQLSGSKDFSSTIKSMPVDSTRLDVKDLPFDSTMYWRVRPVIDGSETDWSDIWNFRTIKMPESKPVKLLSPTDGAKDQVTNIELTWQNVENATKYTIQIANENNFEVLLVDESVEKTSYQNSDLKYNEDYYWRIRADVPGVETRWSNINSFSTTEANKLSAPVQISPENGAGEVSQKPTFKWKVVDGADSYILHANRINPGVMVIEIKVKETSYTPEQILELGTTYDWRVRAINNGDSGKWSDIESFTTESITPAVTLVSPTDKAEVSTTEVLLKWETLQGVSGYTVQLAWDENFSGIIVNETTANNSYQTSNLETGRTYYWRAQAVNDGDVENWSSTASFTIKVQDDPNSSDRVALMDLYKATNGDQWANNRGWGSNDPLGTWYGIDTNAEGRVTRIDLSGNNLTGSLPSSIGNLTKVTYFNVKQNYITGSIPSSIGQMASLTYLLLNGTTKVWNVNDPHHPGKPPGGYRAEDRSNNFTGTIPSSLGNLVNLKWLEISGTGKPGEGLTGAIPSSLGNLTNLLGLDLSYNKLSSLPTSLGNLTNLVHLALSNQGVFDVYCTLEGEGFPQWIANLTNLKFLWFQNNEGMGGTLPDLSGLTKLEVVLMDKLGLTGHIPQYFTDGTMPNINMVQLAWNNFTGTMPKISEPNNLAAFTVDGNNLTGTIPASWGTSAASKIINFGLGWNNLEGEIPDLDNMYQLRYFRGISNNFTGSMPKFDTTNESLQFINLSDNKLSGHIPASLAEVAKLPLFDVLNISNNNFTESDIVELLNALEANGNLDKIKY